MKMVQYLHNFFKIACWTSICICSLYNTNIQTFPNLNKNNNYLASKVKMLQKQKNSKGWQNYYQFSCDLGYVINDSMKIYM